MKKMTEGSITRHLLAYALPLIFGNFFQLTYNAVDSIIIGKFAGEGAVAAVSGANPVMTIVILGVSGICIGASVLLSEFFGAGDEKQFRREYSTMMLSGLIFSLIILIAGILSSGYILRLMNVPEEILPIAIRYLRIIFVGFIFTFLYNAMSQALRSVGDSKTPVRFLMLSSVLNGCLDVLLIAGLHMGVTGAAIATVTAEAISAILCWFYINRRIPMLKLQNGEWVIDKEMLGKTIRHGGVTALQQCCQPIGKVMIQSCINAQGISMIAAFNAVNRIDDCACIPEQSISHGMMTCIAQNRGAGRNDRVRETVKKGLRLEVLYWICICCFTLLLKTPIMKLFAPKESVEMIRMGVEYLTLMAFFYVFPGFTNGFQGVFRGMKKMTVTLCGTLIQITLRVIFVFILVPRIGMSGAAYACMAGWSMMILFELFMFAGIRKEMNDEQVI